MLNLTATEPTQAGFLTAWPAGQPRPLASTLNFLPGDNVANLVMVGLGPGGTLSLYQFGGNTHVVADVVGYVSCGPAPRAPGTPRADLAWAGVDSNHRRRCRQIYSLLPLATRAPTQSRWIVAAG